MRCLGRLQGGRGGDGEDVEADGGGLSLDADGGALGAGHQAVGRGAPSETGRMSSFIVVLNVHCSFMYVKRERNVLPSASNHLQRTLRSFYKTLHWKSIFIKLCKILFQTS